MNRSLIFKKSLIALIITAVMCCAGLLAADKVFADTKGNIDAVSYKMNLRLDTENDSLKETVTIKVRNNTNKTVKELVIRDMTPAILKYDKSIEPDANKGKKTKITSIRLKGSKKDLKFKCTKGKTVLRVKLGKAGAIAPGETGSIVVRMKTDIPERQDRFHSWERR